MIVLPLCSHTQKIQNLSIKTKFRQIRTENDSSSQTTWPPTRSNKRDVCALATVLPQNRQLPYTYLS